MLIESKPKINEHGKQKEQAPTIFAKWRRLFNQPGSSPGSTEKLLSPRPETSPLTVFKLSYICADSTHKRTRMKPTAVK